MSRTAPLAAAKNWQPDGVRRLLAQSPALLGARHARGRTALHVCAGAPAAGNGARVPASIATVREFLNAGADVVHEIRDGRELFRATPLWYALARGRNARRPRFLLHAGASPDNCLWTVIWSNEPVLVRLLLDAGARTDVRFDGEAPLIDAARLGRERAVPPLVAAGADITARDAKGRTAAEHARGKRLAPGVLAALGQRRQRTRGERQ